MYTLISTLITAGWTKKADSDGTTYSSSGVQVTSGNSGANGLGNTNAWVRLQAPSVNHGSVVNQKREITIQRGTTDLNWRIKYSASAGFTGGSPGISQTASSTDEVVMHGAGTDAAPTYSGSWFPANNTYRWNVCAGGSAEFYSFAAWGMITGTNGGGSMGICLDTMAPGSHSALDVDPAVFYMSSNSANAGFLTSDCVAQSSYNTTNVTFPALARAWLGATSAAGILTAGTNNQNMNLLSYGGSPGIGSNMTLGANPWTGNDDLLPAAWARSGLTAPCGFKGFSSLFLQGTVARRQWDTCNVLGTRDKIYVGYVWLPWDGSLPRI